MLRRVSSTEQAEGYGLDSQATDCAKFAKANGIEIVGDFAEDARSTTLIDEREGGRAALDAMLRTGAGVLLLARRDRLARDPYVVGHAERAVGLMGGRILYAEGGNGREDSDLLLGDIQNAIAAHERRAIVARLRKGREEKASQHPSSRAQGGKVPHGYRRTDTALVIDEQAAAEVRQVFTLVKSGQSLRKVAAAMTEATGRPWGASAVEAIAKREVYKLAEPGRIVDGRVWKAAQAAMASRRRSPGKSLKA